MEGKLVRRVDGELAVDDEKSSGARPQPAMQHRAPEDAGQRVLCDTPERGHDAEVAPAPAGAPRRGPGSVSRFAVNDSAGGEHDLG